MDITIFNKDLEELNNKSNQISLKIDQMSKNTILIKFIGLIDTYNSEILRLHLSKLFLIKGIEVLIFDFEGLNYMSSTGVGLMSQLAKECVKLNIKLYFMNIKYNIKEVLDLLGFTSFFNIIEHISDIGNEKKNMFPLIFKCPECSIKLKVIRAGNYVCSSCKIKITILEDGSLKE